MSPIIVVTTTFCGSALIATPYIHNVIMMKLVHDTMIAMDKTVHLQSDIPDYTDIVCLISGILLVIAGLVLGSKDQSKKHPSN